VRVSNDVLGVLSRCEADGNTLRLPEQLERKQYLAVNKVIEAAGGKWQRGRQVHVFERPAADAMEQVLLTGEVTVPQDFGYYPTPPRIVARMLEQTRVRMHLRFLEPSAGQGAIARGVAVYGPVDCIELLPDNCAKLTEMLDDHVNYGFTVRQADFLTIAPDPVYDRVVMNPPFEKRADIHHVRHALKFLKPDGLLVSIMSAGVLFRSDRLTEDFRDLVAHRCGLISELPEDAFKSSGTSVRTVVVSIPGEAP